jgi:PhnB protein
VVAPQPYLSFPGTAREALSFYQHVFGGDLSLNTYAEFGRTDGADEAIAHGVLNGPVSLYASDAAPDEDSFVATSGLMFALLGAASPSTLGEWFHQLAEGGTVVDDLQSRPWNASDGQVRDRYGVLWLIGFEHGGC